MGIEWCRLCLVFLALGGGGCYPFLGVRTGVHDSGTSTSGRGMRTELTVDEGDV